MDCLKCDGSLVELTFSPTIGSTIRLDRCSQCNGVWIDKAQLDQYLDQDSWGIDSWAIDADRINELDDKMARCPRCELRLIKAPSRRDPDIIIDYCDKCAGVWLDSTELDQLETPRKVPVSLVDHFLKLIDRE